MDDSSGRHSSPAIASGGVDVVVVHVSRIPAGTSASQGPYLLARAGRRRGLTERVHEDRDDDHHPDHGDAGPRDRPAAPPLPRRRLDEPASLARLLPGERRGSPDAVDGHHLEQPPLSLDPLELVHAVVGELEPRSGDRVAERRRNEDLPRLPRAHHARADVDGEPSDLPLHQLDLADVQAGADLDPDLPDAVGDRARASDRVRGPVEPSEEPVPCGVELPAPESLQLRADDRVVPLDEGSPAKVAQIGRDLRRPHDVREEHGRQHGAASPRRHARQSARPVSQRQETLSGVPP